MANNSNLLFTTSNPTSSLLQLQQHQQQQHQQQMMMLFNSMLMNNATSHIPQQIPQTPLSRSESSSSNTATNSLFQLLSTQSQQPVQQQRQQQVSPSPLMFQSLQNPLLLQQLMSQQAPQPEQQRQAMFQPLQQLANVQGAYQSGFVPLSTMNLTLQQPAVGEKRKASEMPMLAMPAKLSQPSFIPQLFTSMGGPVVLGNAISQVPVVVQKRRRKRRKANSCSSKFRGVSWHKRDRRWVARAWVNGKTENLGTFVSEKLAAIAVDERLIFSYGVKDAEPLLNFPDPVERLRVKKEEELNAQRPQKPEEEAQSEDDADSITNSDSSSSRDDLTTQASSSPKLGPQRISHISVKNAEHTLPLTAAESVKKLKTVHE